MARGYYIGRRPKHRVRKLIAVMTVSVVIFGGIVGFVIWNMNKSPQSTEIEGIARNVEQQEDVKSAVSKTNINEPYFSMQLPSGWKETERLSNKNERSITWQSKIKKEDNRWLKVYVDLIPPDLAINRLLPLDVAGAGVSHRQMSDNCKNFTTAKKDVTEPQKSKWQGVEFLCDLPRFVQNKVGTGTVGALNATTVSGADKGRHKYFFVYTDHNIHPDYPIFYEMLKSFKAK
jgi:hypothetical protein